MIHRGDAVHPTSNLCVLRVLGGEISPLRQIEQQNLRSGGSINREIALIREGNAVAGGKVVAEDVHVAAQHLKPRRPAAARFRAQSFHRATATPDTGGRPDGSSMRHRRHRGRRPDESGHASPRRSRQAPRSSASALSVPAAARSGRGGPIRLSDGLNSLWRTPVPAVMRCNWPARMIEPLPMLSLCSSAPSRT